MAKVYLRSSLSISLSPSLQPHGCSTPSHGSSIMSGSATNTMKPAISEASTGGAIPLASFPSAAVCGHTTTTSQLTLTPSNSKL